MNNKSVKHPFYKMIWCNIRNWQKANHVSDAKLAAALKVTERTLKVYDQSAHHITLEKIDNLLAAENISITDIFNERVRRTNIQQGSYFVWDTYRKNAKTKKI